MTTQDFLNVLIQKKDLTSIQAEALMNTLLGERVTPVQIGSILTALAIKGETEGEITGFIHAMRDCMKTILSAGMVVDTCGTGGDRSGTFNISTATAFVVAGGGVCVAKHGNRAASSQCGSADVLEALGVHILLSSKQALVCLQRANITFLFAPLYHPSLKHVSLIRKELAFPTIFNYLGPFLNPAKTYRQVIGVPNRTIAQTMAQVARKLEYEHVLIVTSSDGLDEISITSSSTIFEIKGSTVKETIVNPQEMGIPLVLKERLQGGDKYVNAQIIRAILNGEKGPQRDIVLLNAAAVFYVSGKVDSINKGIEMARDSIDSKKAYNALKLLITYSNENKTEA
jgi:anthranilate phosphoribosyltransferase